MERFTVLDISGDIGLRAYGEDIKDAFINAAIGMYSLITGLDAIEEEKTIDISVEGHSIEGLLVSWLNELIFYFDAYGFIGEKVTINELTLPASQLPSFSTFQLKASISGEGFDPQRHESKLLIKAATYHKLRIERVNDMWEIDVIFDI
ncbi:MAG: archease [Nitrospirota bacterium]